jgi:hypothetical protein
MSPRTPRHGNRFRWLALAALCIGLEFWSPAHARLEAQGNDGESEPPVARGALRRANNRSRTGIPSSPSQDEEPTLNAPIEPQAIDLKPGEIAMLVHFRDGGSLRMKLRAKAIPIVTAYGKLEIPAEDIQGIELAPRFPDDVSRKVKEAIVRLGSAKPEERNAAGPELFNLKEKAFIALVRASRAKDKELAKRANELVDELHDLVPAALLDAPMQDTIETDDSRFAGEIPLTVVEAASPQFGNVQLKMSDVQSVSIESNARLTELRNGNLMQFEGQIGKTLSLRVTGAPGGTVWGTGTYSTQSSVASAAVHAGLLRPGQTGVVRVRIKPHQQFFSQSFQNGIASQQMYGQHGAFSFVR